MAIPTDLNNQRFDSILLYSSRVVAPPTLSEQENAFLTTIKALPLEKILDQAEGEAQCKAIGQQIFDHFKGLPGGDSKAGIEAMRKIADSLPFQCEDGRDRKENVIRAWDRVGDANEYWMH